MHFKNARNASVYAVFRAFFTQSLAKLRIWTIILTLAGKFNANFYFSADHGILSQKECE